MGCIVYQKGLYYKSKEKEMGYRSEVILAVGPEVMPQFMVTMAKSPEARELCWADHDEMVKDYCDIKGAFLFRWGGIKWYDSYEGIQALQDFIQWCDSEDIEVDGKIVEAAEYYRFVRIGEDTDDNEVQGWGFDIHIERTATY
jgi:hypothetical protein